MVILDLCPILYNQRNISSCYFFKNADLNASYNIVQYEKLGLLKSFVHKHLIKLLCPKGTQTCALAVYNLIVHSSAAA